MANELDELTGPTMEEGNDVKVIAKQLPIKVGFGSKVFEFFLWFPLIIPGLVFLFMKVNAGKYFSQLQQKLQHDASQIDNYQVQRGEILKNAVGLVERAIDLDKSTFTELAAYRSGNPKGSDAARNETAEVLDKLENKINIAFENYPDLKAHREIMDAMQQNSYLQKEITAARELYNDTVNTWNSAVYAWPTKMIVAAKRNYTTRLPFIASKEQKELASKTFF